MTATTHVVGWRVSDPRWRGPCAAELPEQRSRVASAVTPRSGHGHSRGAWQGPGRPWRAARSAGRLRICIVEIEPGRVLRVAPLHALVVLKMAAYVDRPAGREKDLGDLAVIVEGYVDEERRFSDEVIDLGLPYPDVSPYLLGADLARLVNYEERVAIRNFLAMAHDENDSHATLARMAQAAPPEYRNPAQLLARLDAFESGLGV